MERLKEHIDIAGLFTSGLCAIHCLALPLLFSLGFFTSLTHSVAHHSIELIVYGITLIFASTAVINGWRKHANAQPLILFGLGFSLVTCGLLMDSNIGHVIMATGGLFIAFGHFLNYSLLRRLHSA
jgi:hypothetical protein